MAYFVDLSKYRYFRYYKQTGLMNVGWLAKGYAFNTFDPTEELLAKLWNFCRISVKQSRGGHDCEFCPGKDCNYVVRDGEPLGLGTSEIRVFSKTGHCYAAPTLIYHYMSAHRYMPPEGFLWGLLEGPAPPSEEYFELLDLWGMEWSKTSSPPEQPIRSKYDPEMGERVSFRLPLG